MWNKIAEMHEIDIMARTIYGEARGEYTRVDGGLSALIAVGNVIMNRVDQKSWFGRSIRDVCLKPYQFSCWNDTDVNRQKLINVTPSCSLYKECLAVAEAISRYRYPDLTKGADHYYSVDLKVPPKWALSAKECVHIGKHRFFKLIVKK
ncbi:MAG: cell wall hydrolase [Candidatus Paracaedibacteraceae bacterium]|nr:cell wall hydrolase [Candidatus Paracaedibacteraceae bacterium]